MTWNYFISTSEIETADSAQPWNCSTDTRLSPSEKDGVRTWEYSVL